MNSASPIAIPAFMQHLLFGAGDLQIIQGGYNSDVLLLSHSRQVVIKVIGNKKGIRLTTETATRLGQHICRYRQMLQHQGVPVPRYLDWAVTQQHDNGQVFLFVIEPFSGYSLSGYVDQGKIPDSHNVSRMVLEAAEPVIAAACANNFSDAGFDPKTNNFVYMPGDGCVYVDFMPPRFRMEDGVYLVEYPNLSDPAQVELWKWKYFTAEGLVTIALYQIGRLSPENFQDAKKLAFAWLSERGYRRPLQYLEFLAQAGPAEIGMRSNPYELRYLMCELASKNYGKIDHQRVEEFFLRTHFEGFLPEDVLFWAQDRLIQLTSTAQLQ